ncbi:anaerobic C4-dicarboxylate transporter [Campylobacter fetus]|uniref:anaerobic C4-dicarboxylate transporter n=1 Tax=Campylobacter fetus TaxID=196 RepID=UPI000818B061|nr:anaerobic C4-dicarboxylate transporter [Campylobacter fetus]OCS06075.1 C4-dicarboxylate ABC transporter [Campylobacter fetus subsp. testudinum]
MDIMLILQVIVLFGAIFLGVKLGGMGIGYAGGLGVVILALVLGMKPGNIPWDVILIIMSVIAAITAMQMAGGLDYLVQIAEKILRKNPKYINYTIFAGTGHTAFSMIPVIVEVAKGQNIKPAAPLSIAVVASQIAITASPVSAAVVFMSGILEPLGCSYPMLLAICIPTTFIGCMITSFIVSTFWNLDLDKDPVYQQRLRDGLVKEVKGAEYKEVSKSAKTSVAIFLIGVLAVVFYATAISKNVGLIDPVILGRDHAIISFMLTIATLIIIVCKVRTDTLVQSSVFKSGMVACVCVLGVAWLGDTFVSGHIEGIKGFASDLVGKYPFLLSVALFFASMLLYSQAATAKAIIPAVILALGITPENSGQIYIVVASFAAVSALFVLPTYPTLLGAVQMDDTGTTRIGKYVFNHAFLVPGVLAIAISVALGFILAPMML